LLYSDVAVSKVFDAVKTSEASLWALSVASSALACTAEALASASSAAFCAKRNYKFTESS
jgi:hypothetical protein